MTGKRPCAVNHHHRGQKLSKIETLRLARNYLVLLTEMVFYSTSYSDLVTGQILAFGLGQQSLNQLAVLLNINGSIRVLGQPSAQVQQIFAKYSFFGKGENVTRDLEAESSDNSNSNQSEMMRTTVPLHQTVAATHHQKQQQCQSIFADDFK